MSGSLLGTSVMVFEVRLYYSLKSLLLCGIGVKYWLIEYHAIVDVFDSLLWH